MTLDGVRDRLRWTPGCRPAGWVASTSFAAEAGRIVDALCRMRLQVSLYVLRFDGLPAAQAASLVEQTLGEEALVGRLPDRGVGLLLIDGVASSPAAKRANLTRRLAKRLASRGEAPDGIRVHVAERHGWSDEIEGAAHVVEDMMNAPALVLPLHARLDG